ncbi:MAG: substrate-binding domain-containing protein [Treponemataceae bacterium]|nr:substrate-binding domain-containing protein [Treponemataceae bacterium]
MKLERIIKFIVFFFLIVSICICGSYIYLSYNELNSDAENENERLFSSRSKSILITGSSENEDYLKQIYEGVLENCEMYDSSVQLYVPSSKAEKVNLQSLLYYGGFINADCVISYIDSSPSDLIPPKNSSGVTVPLITVGNYDPDLPQISFIGINYSELGRIFASEIISFLNSKGTVFILNTSSKNDLNYSTLVSSLLSSLKQESNIRVEISAVLKDSSFSLQDSIRQQIVSMPNIDVLVSLTEESTILATQTVTDLNKAGKINIIAFGEGTGSQSYYDKGLITELISIDSKDIGKKALDEFYEFSTKGSANSYVMADVKVQRNEK